MKEGNKGFFDTIISLGAIWNMNNNMPASSETI